MPTPEAPYDGSTSRSWRWGTETITTTTDGTIYHGPDGSDSRWAVGMTPLRGLVAGSYSITAAKFLSRQNATGDMDEVRIAVYKTSDESTWSLVTSKDISALCDMTTTGNLVQNADMSASPLSFTVTAADISGGYSFWLALCLHGPSGRTTAYPGMRILASGPASYRWRDGADVAGDTIPSTLTAATSEASYKYIPYFSAVIATTVRRPVHLDSLSVSDATEYVVVPQLASEHAWHAYEYATVIDGGTLTFSGKKWNPAAGAADTWYEAVIDMGTTDQMTFEGANVILPGGQAGDAFDLAVNMWPSGSTTRGDLFWINRTTGQGAEGAADFTTISHKAKTGAARRGSYELDSSAATNPDWVEITGTAGASLSKMAVASRLLVAFGDSQVATGSTATLQRLGSEFRDALADPLPAWIAGVSGNRLSETVASTHTAGYLRVATNTPGVGDLVEMRGVLFAFLGEGINDVAQISNAGECAAKLADLRDALLAVLAAVFRDGNTGDNQAVLLGLPESRAAWVEDYHLDTIRDWNSAIRDAAIALCVPFYDPYGLVNANFASYISADDTHYNDTGAAAVAAELASKYENDLVPSAAGAKAITL